jgi:hypothetical protein
MPSRSRTVLLTGTAGGIGRVMTRALLDDGHSVAAVDRDAASLERLKTLAGAAERLYPIVAEPSDRCSKHPETYCHAYNAHQQANKKDNPHATVGRRWATSTIQQVRYKEVGHVYLPCLGRLCVYGIVSGARAQWIIASQAPCAPPGSLAVAFGAIETSSVVRCQKRFVFTASALPKAITAVSFNAPAAPPSPAKPFCYAMTADLWELAPYYVICEDDQFYVITKRSNLSPIGFDFRSLDRRFRVLPRRIR